MASSTRDGIGLSDEHALPVDISILGSRDIKASDNTPFDSHV